MTRVRSSSARSCLKEKRNTHTCMRGASHPPGVWQRCSWGKVLNHGTCVVHAEGEREYSLRSQIRLSTVPCCFSSDQGFVINLEKCTQYGINSKFNYASFFPPSLSLTFSLALSLSLTMKCSEQAAEHMLREAFSRTHLLSFVFVWSNLIKEASGPV